jgi:hypothetical protein
MTAKPKPPQTIDEKLDEVIDLLYGVLVKLDALEVEIQGRD